MASGSGESRSESSLQQNIKIKHGEVAHEEIEALKQKKREETNENSTPNTVAMKKEHDENNYNIFLS